MIALLLHFKDWLNPVCFYNVSKGKEKCGADGSFYNLEEVAFLCGDLLVVCHETSDSIIVNILVVLILRTFYFQCHFVTILKKTGKNK